MKRYLMHIPTYRYTQYDDSSEEIVSFNHAMLSRAMLSHAGQKVHYHPRDVMEKPLPLPRLGYQYFITDQVFHPERYMLGQVVVVEADKPQNVVAIYPTIDAWVCQAEIPHRDWCQEDLSTYHYTWYLDPGKQVPYTAYHPNASVHDLTREIQKAKHRATLAWCAPTTIGVNLQ